MAHESFEDQHVADLLNQHFIAIKVDREERPDVDHVYMMYCQALTGEGGWPLTVIMTPDAHPIFAGTYYPKHARYGRPGLIDILQTMHERWLEDGEKLAAASVDVTRRLQPVFASAPGSVDAKAAIHLAADRLTQRFDDRYGGFGDAPKFPSFHQHMFLLRYHRFTGENDALHMVKRTLEGIARGGIYDHVGGGFSRYSTDGYWQVPHFEKMLYDNALAILTYTEAYQQTKSDLFARVIRETVQYVTREMTSGDGAFFAAQDADSEGQEGRFYVWRPDDIAAALGDAEGALYCDFYDVTEEGNFEGYNVPNFIHTDVDSFAKQHDMSVEALWRVLREANETLYEWRSHRVHPGTDDKILTTWNAMMIAALAKAGAALGEDEYTRDAVRAVHFMEAMLVRQADGRLLARYRDGEAAILAYADDYAYLVWAYIELYQATLDLFYLNRAKQWQLAMDELFWDDADDGYFLYGHDAETLIARPKTAYDGATPSANSVAAYNLVRLYAMTGNEVYAERADSLFTAFGESLETSPTEQLFLLMARMLMEVGSTEVVAVAGKQTGDMSAIIARWHQQFSPEGVLLTPPARGDEGAMYAPIESATTLYICRHFQCDRPQTAWEEALANVVSAPPQLDV